MIDFSQLKTAEEKLISLYIDVFPGQRQKEICRVLGIPAISFRRCIKKCVSVLSYKNKYGIKLYASSTVQGVPSTVQDVPSTLQGVPSTVQDVPSTLQGVPSTDPSPLS